MFPYNIVETQGEELIARCVERNIGFIDMKPLAGGAIEDGDMSLAMGTAGCMGFVHEEPRFTPNMITIPHTVKSKTTYTTCVAICACASVLRYFKDTFGAEEIREAEEKGISL